MKEKLIEIRKECADIETNLTQMIAYHGRNQQSFFKNYDKIENFKQLRFLVRHLLQTIDEFSGNYEQKMNYEINR